MAAPPITELTTRARDIFQRVVEEYLDSGQPVLKTPAWRVTSINWPPPVLR